ncbi:MAG: hypothetical protein KDJ69_12245 [Nitratireductor sp.]|nr:hypothetical protein [Nitratireductor sp.]
MKNSDTMAQKAAYGAKLIADGAEGSGNENAAVGPNEGLVVDKAADEVFQYLKTCDYLARESVFKREPTPYDVLNFAFKDAMRTHRKIPDRERTMLNSMRSTMPEVTRSDKELYDIQLDRLLSGMPSHYGNTQLKHYDRMALDRMMMAFDLLNFIQSKDWHRLRKLVLLRANGATVDQCSRFWNKRRPTFSRQYLLQLIQKAYGQVYVGLERKHGIYRNHRSFVLKTRKT